MLVKVLKKEIILFVNYIILCRQTEQNQNRRGGTLEVEIAGITREKLKKPYWVLLMEERLIIKILIMDGIALLGITVLLEDNNAQINTLNPPWNPNDPDFINRT